MENNTTKTPENTDKSKTFELLCVFLTIPVLFLALGLGMLSTDEGGKIMGRVFLVFAAISALCIIVCRLWGIPWFIKARGIVQKAVLPVKILVCLVANVITAICFCVIWCVSRINWDKLEGAFVLCLIIGFLMFAYGRISYFCIEYWYNHGFSMGLLTTTLIFLGGFIALPVMFLRFWPDFGSGILKNA